MNVSSDVPVSSVSEELTGNRVANVTGNPGASTRIRDCKAAHDPAGGPLRVERITITRGRLCADVRIAEGAPLRTNETIAAHALDAYPQLAAHSCINKHGPTFAAVIAHTSLAHLLEHLIIAEQAKLCAACGHEVTAPFIGTTEPTGERTARIEVSFLDDLTAITALHRALDFANMLVLEDT